MTKKTVHHPSALLGVLLVSLLLFSASVFAAELPSSPSGKTVAAKVVRIVDGDTVRVLFGGWKKDVPVRLIGIDTPESRRNDRAKLQASESDSDVNYPPLTRN